MVGYAPILVGVIFGLATNGTHGFAEAAEDRRIERILSPAAIAQTLHDGVNGLLKHFRELKPQ